MLFEVYRDKQRLMWTRDKACIPSEKTIQSLKAARLKIKVDGKILKKARGANDRSIHK